MYVHNRDLHAVHIDMAIYRYTDRVSYRIVILCSINIEISKCNCNCNCNISTGSPLSKLIFSGALHIHTNIHKTKIVATY